jgi:hypothetical protein
VLQFPFIRELIYPYYPYEKKVLLSYGSVYGSIPEGKKRRWYNAAKEVLEIVNRKGHQNRGLSKC